jgi:DNA polymerase II large subunit
MINKCRLVKKKLSLTVTLSEVEGYLNDALTIIITLTKRH